MPEIIVQVIIAAFACLSVADYLDAAGARCDVRPTVKPEWCSVWGGTEGPIGGDPNYRDQNAYLRSGRALIVVLLVAALAPFVVPNAVVGLTLALAIPSLGMWWLGIGPPRP